MQLTTLLLVAWAEIFLCWILWFLAFVKPSRQAKGETKTVRATSSRWGIVLVFVGFMLIFMWVKPVGFRKATASLVTGMILAPVSVLLAWSSAHELGRQWRLEAALSADHNLIQSGPYRWIRHPIYTSMFGMLMATGAAYAWWPMWIAGAAAFIAGTEIRVRAEDKLLEQRFEEAFRQYRSKVPAYIPLIR